ncbi:MAG: DUF1841 family protein [Gammaproteobacteria bacterium]
MFVQNSTESRSFFVEVRRKVVARELLQPLEAMVAHILSLHPEYENLLADKKKALSDEYISAHFEINPFLHLGLHVALQEQLQANRPMGIAAIYQSLKLKGVGDEHEICHRMMQCLTESLYKAQASKAMPDEVEYLACLRSI